MHDQKFEIDNAAIDQEEAVATAEVDAILEKVLELGGGDIAVGTVQGRGGGRARLAHVHQHPRGRTRCMGIRDAGGACRYLEFGNLPIPEDIKDFHRQKVAEREVAEGRKMDYYAAIDDFWAISKGRLKGLPGAALVTS